MVTAIIVVGFVLLAVFATLIGTSMDTERRRARWRRVAEQRRRIADQRRELLPEHIDDPYAGHSELPTHPSRTTG